MVSSEQVWKGLKLELSKNEIRKIFQAKKYEKGDYYDFDVFYGVIKKALNKEIDIEYFTDWCVLVANCFNEIKSYGNSKLAEVYEELAWFFDGVSFIDKYNEKDLKDYIATLKSFDYEIKRAKIEINEPFLTEGVERILVIDHANWNYDSTVYRVIIKNYNTKEWEIKYVDDHDFSFDENVNYTFVDEKEFEKIFNEFYHEDGDWNEVHNLKF